MPGKQKGTGTFIYVPFFETGMCRRNMPDIKERKTGTGTFFRESRLNLAGDKRGGAAGAARQPRRRSSKRRLYAFPASESGGGVPGSSDEPF
jgi:hypothetical protein